MNALILSAALAQPADAGPIFLSDFLGGDSGTAVVASNHAAWADAKLTVPEPGTSLLVMAGVVYVMRRRRTA